MLRLLVQGIAFGMFVISLYRIISGKGPMKNRSPDFTFAIGAYSFFVCVGLLAS